MQIIAAAPDKQWEELIHSRPQIEWVRVSSGVEFAQYPNASSYFNMNDPGIMPVYASLNRPVVIHSVTDTLQELNAPPHVFRINAWPGFLQRSSWEIAGNTSNEINAVLQAMGIHMYAVADEPGFISARIIAMVINEAYLALEQEVSTKEEIDTAMKLGTNYPFGPFEWANAIGIENVFSLLEKLNRESNRYKPSAILAGEAELKRS